MRPIYASSTSIHPTSTVGQASRQAPPAVATRNPTTRIAALIAKFETEQGPSSAAPVISVAETKKATALNPPSPKNAETATHTTSKTEASFILVEAVSSTVLRGAEWAGGAVNTALDTDLVHVSFNNALNSIAGAAISVAENASNATIQIAEHAFSTAEAGIKLFGDVANLPFLPFEKSDGASDNPIADIVSATASKGVEIAAHITTEAAGTVAARAQQTGNLLVGAASNVVNATAYKGVEILGNVAHVSLTYVGENIEKGIFAGARTISSTVSRMGLWFA